MPDGPILDIVAQAWVWKHLMCLGAGDFFDPVPASGWIAFTPRDPASMLSCQVIHNCRMTKDARNWRERNVIIGRPSNKSGHSRQQGAPCEHCEAGSLWRAVWHSPQPSHFSPGPPEARFMAPTRLMSLVRFMSARSKRPKTMA